MREQDFIEIILANPVNAEILSRMPALDLPDGWLVSGCLFQTVWNHVTGRPAGYGIKDYDVFYFDDSDLSWAAEDRVIRRVSAALSDVAALIEVKNQARVHLWYEGKFGAPRAPIGSSCEGIDGFMERTSKIGITTKPDGGYRIYAPEGLQLIPEMMAIPCRDLAHFSEHRFREKIARWRGCWPELRVAD